MDENKWEYDYSSSNNPAGDTGYPNVGSSGMNTDVYKRQAAIQCNDFRPGITKSGPPLYATSRPTRRKELRGNVLI